MASDWALELLALPASTVRRVSQSAVRDAVGYFDADVVAIPGARDAEVYAAVRDAVTDVPVVHPQLARGGERIQQYRYTPDAGVHEPADTVASADAIDVLAVQQLDVLEALGTRLATDERQTRGGAATFVLVPRLTVEWNRTSLSATLPGAEQLSALARRRPEPVTILAGGQPADYHHEWELSDGNSAVRVPVAGLGATDREGTAIALHRCTAGGGVAPEVVDADGFGLQALHGVGQQTARQLRTEGCRTTDDVGNLAADELARLPGIGRATAERMHAHADVLDTGEPLVLTNKSPVKTRDGRPPVCLDIETDGLSPTIIWQFGVYDPATDSHQAFIERNHPEDPEPVLEAFVTWFIANHSDRTVLTWNGHSFDYRYIEQFLEQYLPEYTDAWADVWTYDLYKWAVRDRNALLPGRTNKLTHVARALGYDGNGTGLTGAQTAAAYQEFMRNPEQPDAEPDWDRHRAYCADDCRALWHVYRAITDATRRDMTDSGTSGAAGQQAGLTDF